MPWENTITEQRAAWLIDLAWAGGNRDLQRGWWAYCQAELDKLGPGFRERALAALKAMREHAE